MRHLANAITGVRILCALLLFCLPLFPSPAMAGIVCAAASLSALEELAIMILRTTAPDLDVSSLASMCRAESFPRNR